MERRHLVRVDEGGVAVSGRSSRPVRPTSGGWAVSDRLHKELALEALRKALAIRRPREGLTHHADRGSQYCSIEYQAALRKHGIRISMSGKGNCFDNAVVETFFKTLKVRAGLAHRVPDPSARPRRRLVVTSTASTILSGVIRHSTMSVRLSSKGWPDSYKTALHKSDASPRRGQGRHCVPGETLPHHQPAEVE